MRNTPIMEAKANPYQGPKPSCTFKRGRILRRYQLAPWLEEMDIRVLKDLSVITIVLSIFEYQQREEIQSQSCPILSNLESTESNSATYMITDPLIALSRK